MRARQPRPDGGSVCRPCVRAARRQADRLKPSAASRTLTREASGDGSAPVGVAGHGETANILRLYRVRLRARSGRSALRSWGSPRGRAAVRLAGLELQPAELRRRALARDRRHTRRCSSSRATRTASPEHAGAGAPHPRCVTAAPLLEAQANASGPKGSESVQLVGADASLQGARRRARAPHRRCRRSGTSARSCCPRRWRARSASGSSVRKSPSSSPGEPRRRRSTTSWARRQIGALTREPGRGRAARLRPGNDGPAGACEPHPRAARRRVRRRGCGPRCKRSPAGA